MSQRLLYKTPITPVNTAVANSGLSEFPAAEDHDHGISGSGLDHGLLSGLLDDDHTQYALLAGLSGVVSFTAQLKFTSGNESTAAGAALLGANSPAGTLTAPYTWFKMTSSDGSQVYVPAWK